MPTMLSDPTPAMYAVFGAIVVVLGAMALRRQKKSDVITFVIAAALLLALYLADRAVDSPRESVVRKLVEMEKSSKAKKYDDVFKHISENFKYRQLDKKALRDKAGLAEGYFPEGVSLWGHSRDLYQLMENGTAEQEFDFQPVGSPQFRYKCVGVFKLEPDGEWRLMTFRLYPVIGNREEVTIPGL
jgi:hypothetical protein